LYTRSSFSSFDELDVSFVWDQIVRLITTAVPTLTHIFHGNICFTKPSGFLLSKSNGTDGSDDDSSKVNLSSGSGKDSEDEDGNDESFDELEDITVSISNLSGFLQENASSSIYSRCFQAL
jgi:hypothetical protein